MKKGGVCEGEEGCQRRAGRSLGLPQGREEGVSRSEQTVVDGGIELGTRDEDGLWESERQRHAKSQRLFDTFFIIHLFLFSICCLKRWFNFRDAPVTTPQTGVSKGV